jgi:integral membrane protein
MSNQLDKHAKTRKLAHRVGVWEGVSYLVLLFVAMPLKYGMGYQEAVRLTGSAHGFLFVGFMAVLFYAFLTKAITFRKAVWAFVLSLIPFGTFYLSFDKPVD